VQVRQLRGAAVDVADRVDAAAERQFSGGGRKLDHDVTGYQSGRTWGKGGGMRNRFHCLLLLSTLTLAWHRPQAAEPELRIGVQSAFVVDPHVLFLGPNMAAARHLYDSLVGKDAEARWTATLATSWRQIDPQTWEFTLRPNVRFSDGSPFSSEDVIASVRRIPLIPNNPGPYTTNLRTITSTVAVDTMTIRVTTDRPNPLLPGQFTNIFILPKSVTNAPPEDFPAARATIGTVPVRRHRGA
jgi:peptide/nickel transport system substrate-binding protein